MFHSRSCSVLLNDVLLFSGGCVVQEDGGMSFVPMQILPLEEEARTGLYVPWWKCRDERERTKPRERCGGKLFYHKRSRV